jgi:hypothetical protein
MGLRGTECTISKGSYTVTIYASKIRDMLQNKLFIITPPTSISNQPDGPKYTWIVDLLRITRKFTVTGWILNNVDKQKLVNIIHGAGLDGGPATFTYQDGGDAATALPGKESTSFQVYVESCDFNQAASDEPDSAPSDFGKFEISIDLVSGIKVGTSS